MIKIFFSVLFSIALFKNTIANQDQAQQLPTAMVSSPIIKEFADYKEYMGRFIANKTIAIKSNISGYLEKINFTDGQFVKKDAELFLIDNRPYVIALNQAKVNLKLAKINLELAENEFNRSKKLIKTKAISKEEFDIAENKYKQTKISIELIKINIAKAKLDLDYCIIKSPISGKIGRHKISIGNLINNQSTLATVVSNDKVDFIFSVNEIDYINFIKLYKNNISNINITIKPLASNKNYKAVINFIDNQVDKNTASVEFRAKILNVDGFIAPGMFAKAKVKTSHLYKAVMVPDALIGTQGNSRTLLVVEDNKVVKKNVTLGLLDNDLRVIKSGIDRDTKVITTGIQMLRAGMPVKTVATKF